MALFSQDFIERVRSAHELSQVIASYNIQLKRTGSNLVGLCPFHNEKTPSFNVRTTEQYFRCFGCGAKGDVFRFVQMMEKVEFPDAIKLLAERAGIALEFENPAAAREAQRKSSVKSKLQWCCSRALDYFQECLAKPSGGVARQYLESRGFDAGTIEQWRIGWAPNDKDGLSGFLLKSAKDPEQKAKVLEYARQAGLVFPDSYRDGHYVDNYRGRVMFPIFDLQGKPVGFGGRILVDVLESGKKPPKYINSPESALFEKRRLLFGLGAAAKEISLSGVAILVEGYVDVIMCHQYGFRNVVAPLGTSLTDDQVSLLKRVNPKGRVIALFDADSAGQAATMRSIRMFMAQNLPLSVVSGLELKDPGDFLPEFGPEEFAKKLAGAKDSFTHVLDQTLGHARDRDPQAMGVAVREAMEIINLCPDPVTRALMRRRLAAEAGIPEESLPMPAPASPTVRAGAAAPISARPAKKPGLTPPHAAMDVEKRLSLGRMGRVRREARLLRYMWENPDWCARIADEYPPDEWQDNALAELAALVRDQWSTEQPPVLHEIRARTENPEAAERLADVAFPDDEPLSEEDVRQLLGHMNLLNREEEARLLKAEMEEAQKAGDSAKATAVWMRMMQLKKGL
ncbi:MAG: DNA primase [Planctomycetaceae bacterium]|nr:DNA primase [Planctomycetaceae bacterium]